MCSHWFLCRGMSSRGSVNDSNGGLSSSTGWADLPLWDWDHWSRRSSSRKELGIMITSGKVVCLAGLQAAAALIGAVYRYDTNSETASAGPSRV